MMFEGLPQADMNIGLRFRRDAQRPGAVHFGSSKTVRRHETR
jgi:hypothetical protein